MHIGHLLFYTHGRVSRKVWWLTNLLMWGLSAFTCWVYVTFGLHDALFSFILTVLLFWFRTAINFKRLHDRGKTGWRVFTWWLFCELTVIGGFIVYGLLKGDEGENVHGEAP